MTFQNFVPGLVLICYHSARSVPIPPCSRQKGPARNAAPSGLARRLHGRPFSGILLIAMIWLFALDQTAATRPIISCFK
jgi:hypothetical protein